MRWKENYFNAFTFSCKILAPPSKRCVHWEHWGLCFSWELKRFVSEWKVSSELSGKWQRFWKCAQSVSKNRMLQLIAKFLGGPQNLLFLGKNKGFESKHNFFCEIERVFWLKSVFLGKMQRFCERMLNFSRELLKLCEFLWETKVQWPNTMFLRKTQFFLQRNAAFLDKTQRFCEPNTKFVWKTKVSLESAKVLKKWKKHSQELWLEFKTSVKECTEKHWNIFFHPIFCPSSFPFRVLFLLKLHVYS